MNKRFPTPNPATLAPMLAFDKQDRWISRCNFKGAEIGHMSLVQNLRARILYVHSIHAELDDNYIY